MTRSRSRAAQFGDVASPWAYTLPVGPAIFGLYDSMGDVIISSDTTIAGEVNGPMVCRRYGTLTLDAKLTGPQCRGFVVACDHLNIRVAGAGISMDGQGALGSPAWPNYNLTIPDAIALSGRYVDRWTYLAAIRQHGWFIGDPILMSDGRPELGDVLGTITPGHVLLDGNGCGVGGTGALAVLGANMTGISPPGGNGAVGTSAPGGGGGGGATAEYGNYPNGSAGGRGGPGHPWGGGDGAPGSDAYGGNAADGNPYGRGYTAPGGTLLVLVRYSITLAAGYVLSANGLVAPSSYHGAPGGGFVGIACGGSVTIAGAASGVSDIAATATHGAAITYGGTGGDGAVVSKTWSDLGWD